jgi:radical SAM protein with 4Fe4S-binding SPASM domain
MYANRINGSNGNTKNNFCTSCKVSSFIVKKILDSIIARTHVERDRVRENLSDSMWRKGLASVLEGIAAYGPKKPFTSYAPFLIVWNITKACNLKCKHCYEFAAKHAPDELTHKQALDAVDKMAEAGLAYIAISGGEPLVRKDLFDVAKRIRDNGMAFSIATNATLMTKENAKKLKEHGCLFAQVSVDGSNPESHNWFRGVKMFEKTIQGIKNAVAEDISVGISTTVTNHNYHEIPDIINLAEKLGAGTFMYYNFIPTGRGKDIVNLDLTPDQRELLLKSMAKQTKKRKMRLLSTAPQYGRVCVENEAATLAMTHFDYSSPEILESVRFLAEFIGGCGTGRLYCALEPNGDITPCVFIPIKLGNIKEDSLLDVWHNSDAFIKIRDREHFKGNCGVCKYKNVCGGCRARAYAYFNDLQGPDPGCINNRKYFEGIRASAGMREEKPIEVRA